MGVEPQTSVSQRQVYMVLSPRALPYATLALRSLLRNSHQPLHLHLITDSHADKLQLSETMESLQPEARHRWAVFAEDEMLDAEATVFRGLANLRAFRGGHPCWRKITDPLLLSEPGQELVLLDPDLYFPNRFQFEPTPDTGLLLMWQRPNCLFPPEIVRQAMSLRIPLADHVDIGVAHWRAGVDLEWIDWLIGQLGGASLPRIMHIEAIVWAAVAMHGGGGHLDPTRWVCWHRTQPVRLKRRLGVPGVSILKSEPWNQMKCFHGGGDAKYWLPEFESTGLLQRGPDQFQPSPTIPFVEFTPSRFGRQQKAKSVLRSFGYYKLFGAS
jgi:hypothetical protein